MRSIFTASKTIRANYIEKTLCNKPINLPKNQNIKCPTNEALNDDRSLVLKPSIIHRKISDNFNLNRFLLNNSSNYQIRNFGLTNALRRQFSTLENIKTSNEDISYGGDFLKLIDKGSILVDKSLFIKEILEDTAEVILITMPRRSGKSVNLDMLKRFLSVEESKPEEREINKRLFTETIKEENGEYKKLNIANNCKLEIYGKINIGEMGKKSVRVERDSMEFQGKYPVIYIDFKSCKGDSYDAIKRKLNSKIVETIKDFGYLRSHQEPYSGSTIGQEYQTILEYANSGTFLISIRELTKLLYHYHKQEPWILIDEYDAPLNMAFLKLSEEEFEKAGDLFKMFFLNSLKDNSYLEKGVLTGIQYLVRSEMLSGFNNLDKHNITSPAYSKYYGIDRDEMEFLIQRFNINNQTKDMIKLWYNGYKMNYGTELNPIIVEKYNIWSIASFLYDQMSGFKVYWENNSINHYINKNIFKNKEMRLVMEGLINNEGYIINDLTTDFSLDDFKVLKEIMKYNDQIKINEEGKDLFFSYLFITGYLTWDPTSRRLAIPNREIQITLEKKLRQYYTLVFRLPVDDIKELSLELDSIFFEESIQKISEIFTNSFAPKFSTIIGKLDLLSNETDNKDAQGLFGNEDLMHSLLNYLAIQIVNGIFESERYITKPDGKRGRADIVLSKNQKGVLIELKYNNNSKKDSEELDRQQADMALEQAKSYSELLKYTKTKIFIGCNITQQKTLFISGEIIKDKESTKFVYPESKTNKS